MWVFLSLPTLSPFGDLQAPFAPCCQSVGFLTPAFSLTILGDQHDEGHDSECSS